MIPVCRSAPTTRAERRRNLLRWSLTGAATTLTTASLALLGIGRMAAAELLHPPRWRIGERWPGIPYSTDVGCPAGPPAALCPIDGALRVVGPRQTGLRPRLPLDPLRVGDVILAIDGVPTDPLHTEAISEVFHERPAGSIVRLDVMRPDCDGGERLLLSVPLPAAARNPGNLGLAYEDLRLTAADGRCLHGWYMPPPERSPAPAPALIYLHGRQTNRAHVGLSDLAARAWEHQYGLLLVDLFGSGDSDGPVDHWTADDVALACRFLRQQPEVDPERIGLVGFSFGAYKALLAAADPRIRPAATVAVAPSDSRPRSIRLLVPPRRLPPWLRRRLQTGITPPGSLFRVSRPIVRAWIWLMVRRDIANVDPRRLAPAVRGPVMMMHGAEDSTFPPASALAAFERLSGPKEFRWFAGHDHFSICHAGDDLWDPAFTFLDAYLRPGKAAGHQNGRSPEILPDRRPVDRERPIIGGNSHRQRVLRPTPSATADD